MSFFPPQKTLQQKKKEEQDKVADDLQAFLDRMTPEQRKKFWEQHDKDTAKDEKGASGRD